MKVDHIPGLLRREPPINYSGDALAELLAEASRSARQTRITVAGDAFHDKIYEYERFDDKFVARQPKIHRRHGGAAAVAASIFNLVWPKERTSQLRSNYCWVGKDVYLYSHDEAPDLLGPRKIATRWRLSKTAADAPAEALRGLLSADPKMPKVFAWADHGYSCREHQPWLISLMKRFRQAGGYALVDVKPPGRGGYQAYEDALLLKGTLDELRALPDWVQHTLATMGSLGLVVNGGACASAPIIVEVDPTGCGDSVFAVAAVLLASAAANKTPGFLGGAAGALLAAAGAYQATQLGNVPLTASAFSSWLRRPPPVVAFANGCFDGLHEGHKTLLRAAARLGGEFQETRVVVGVNVDEYIRDVKKVEPLESYSIRANNVQLFLRDECKVHATVVPLVSRTAAALLRSIQPHRVVKGEGQQPPLDELVAARGCRASLVYVPLLAGFSSTKLREDCVAR